MTNPPRTPRTAAAIAQATIAPLTIDAERGHVAVDATSPGNTTITLSTEPAGAELTVAGARNLAATLLERVDLIDPAPLIPRAAPPTPPPTRD